MRLWMRSHYQEGLSDSGIWLEEYEIRLRITRMSRGGCTWLNNALPLETVGVVLLYQFFTLRRSKMGTPAVLLVFHGPPIQNGYSSGFINSSHSADPSDTLAVLLVA